MTGMTGEMRRDDLDQAGFWSRAFDVLGRETEVVHMAELVKASRENLFTARLPQTRAYCSLFEAGKIRLMTSREVDLRFATALDLLALIVTHGRLARTAVAKLRPGAFWVRNDGDRLNSRLPAIPLQHLVDLTGREEVELRAMLLPLCNDGALRPVRAADGRIAYIALPGFAEDGQTRRFFRI